MIIRLRNLQKFYDKDQVLDIKSFDFTEGLYCLLGKNGTGKTTLLKIMAGLDMQYRGQVLFEDLGKRMVVNKKEVTMVFQNYYVFDKTVKQNIEYGLKLRGLTEKEIKTRTQYYMHLTGLEGLASKNARKLSAGQQQRLCIARAIATEPKVLLLDEPVSNLDDENKEMICSILRMLEEKKTMVIVMVTHEIALAREITDKIVYINEKQLQFEEK